MFTARYEDADVIVAAANSVNDTSKAIWSFVKVEG